MKQQLRKIVIVAPHPSVEAFAYGKRLRALVCDAGAEFWGSTSIQQCSEHSPKWIVRLSTIKRSTITRTAFILSVIYRALRGPHSEHLFLCVGFVAGFGLAVASSVRKLNYVFINNDNLSLSRRWPERVRRVLHAADEFIVRRSICHILPHSARWPRDDAKTLIVTNSPSRLDCAAALHHARNLGYVRLQPITLYVSGWLVAERGIGMILRAVKRCPEGSIRVILAGIPECPEAAELAKLDCCEAMGLISGVEALAQNYRAHLVAAFYDPRIPINRIAASNKWYDCIATGTPFVTNHGIVTVQPFLQSGACTVVEYDDDDALARTLVDLSKHPDRLRTLQSNVTKLELRAFEDQFEELFSRVAMERPLSTPTPS